MTSSPSNETPSSLNEKGAGETLRETIDRALAARSWLDDRATEVFKDYCAVFNIAVAGGMESWDLYADKLCIRQDLSCRGCYDMTQHYLPAQYFYANQAERRVLMANDADKDRLAKEAKLLRERSERLARLEKEAEQLRQNLKTAKS